MSNEELGSLWNKYKAALLVSGEAADKALRKYEAAVERWTRERR